MNGSRNAMLLAATAGLLLAGCGKSDGSTPPAPTTANVETPPAPPALPSYWFESDFDSWIGKRWDELELFQFMETAPTGMDAGKRYVVFYSRTCEHCEEMFLDDLAPNAAFASMVTAVEVPADKETVTSPDGWALPDTAVEHLVLPLGPNWIITTPLSVRIEDGVVTCAEEGAHAACLELE